MDKKVREAIRYLGFGRNTVDEQTLAMISDSFRELKQAADPKSIYRIFDFKQYSDTKIMAGNLKIESRNLGKNLKGCEQVIFFGATLGTGVDTLLRRYTIADMAKTVVLQACAAAVLEEYCDMCQEKIGEALRKENKYLRPRFSPGYGDFGMEYQEALIRMLDCAKRIGLTMTGGAMMVPTKSVTAVIGVSPTEEKCHIKGCESCEKKDCIYRRDTE
ncbi:Vitamin B12 dependent methionine synthase activation subunit [Faecalicatena acetigenes]|jgi:hypothetical protein|uniref:Vitamin B12 dependent methionine synthase activation subunit n=1 Tax=Faecalicatena acetigenes TaxID=2981790 RepID=A0ABT2TD17_9FIRM|nr:MULTISPECIES: vitamin B12 dependent-methionine synthase activation domain-containing protein [Lachnospiraceae]MCU6748145.1 Vitamin B12 dependent methionine synthase activation subunit [Faecalicatena acetigenes]SCI28917.1 Vitamin B12 dependent methionine synthase%2C activation domain [uncultured Clostridium sp.]